MEIFSKLQVELQMDSLKNSERIKIKTKKKIKFKIRFEKIRMFQLMHHLKLKILIKKNTKSLKKLRIKKIYSKFSILKKCWLISKHLMAFWEKWMKRSLSMWTPSLFILIYVKSVMSNIKDRLRICISPIFSIPKMLNSNLIIIQKSMS